MGSSEWIPIFALLSAQLLLFLLNCLHLSPWGVFFHRIFLPPYDYIPEHKCVLLWANSLSKTRPKKKKESSFQIVKKNIWNFRLENCYQFLELVIIIVIAMHRAPREIRVITMTDVGQISVKQTQSQPQGEHWPWCRSLSSQVAHAVPLGTPEGNCQHK